MRPTLEQLYCNVDVFVEALEHEGVREARAKVMSLFNELIEYWSLVRANRHFTTERDSQLARQVRYRARHFEKLGLKHRRRIARSDVLQNATTNRVLLPTRSRLEEVEAYLLKKISRWPDLDVDVQTLSRKADRTLVKKTLLKRRNRVS
jgi:aspartate/tyrosine/aromatic aminotransferase